MGEFKQLWYLGVQIFKELMFKKKVPLKTFNILFESTQNTQKYGTKITSTEVRKIIVIRM